MTTFSLVVIAYHMFPPNTISGKHLLFMSDRQEDNTRSWQEPLRNDL